jgi:hypothetical protein
MVVTALQPAAVKVPPGYDPAFIKPRIDWRDVVSYPPTEPGNAAEPYVEIARQYWPAGLGASWPEAKGEVSPEMLELAKKGARLTECNFGTEILMLENGQQRLLPMTSHDDLLGHVVALRAVARALSAEGSELYAEGNTDEAVRTYEAGVILCARMVESRESMLQLLVGLAVQGDYDRVTKSIENPITLLCLDEGDDVKYRQWIDYFASLSEFHLKFGEKMSRLIESSALGDWTGNMPHEQDIEYTLAVVLYDEDPLMKRWAILGLATLDKLSRRVKSALRRAEREDPDPYVREAASNALKR